MRLFQYSAEKKKHLKGLLRAFAYVSVIGAVATGVQLRAARAEVQDRTVMLGREMLQLAEATQHDVSHVSINGQSVFVGSSIGTGTPAEVLDRYEGYCKANAAQVPEAWRALAGKTDNDSEKAGLFNAGVLRGGDEEEGTVVCFTRSPESKASVIEALTAFGETGELSAIGNLRYVYTKKSELGNTVVLTAWTDSKFNLADLIPEEGKDVPGGDFAEIPRLPDAHRIISTRIEGTPYGVNVYRTTSMAPDKVAKFYDVELTSNGWTALDPELDEPDRSIGRLYERDGVVLTLATNAKEGATFAALGLAGVGGDVASRR
jgi:hypothetical protein